MRRPVVHLTQRDVVSHTWIYAYFYIDCVGGVTLRLDIGRCLGLWVLAWILGHGNSRLYIPSEITFSFLGEQYLGSLKEIRTLGVDVCEKETKRGWLVGTPLRP